MKNIRTLILGISVLCGVILSSCTESDPNDTTIPAYIEVSAFKVENTPGNSVSSYEGCFTSDINTVEITVKNDKESCLIGVFELPCRVPVLREGKYDILLKPCIKLNGISATRSSYPFYSDVTIKGVNLVPDSTIVVDTQNVHYMSYTNFLWTEYCEHFVTNPFVPDTGATIVKIIKNNDTVLSDNGCAAVYLSPDQTEFEFVRRDSCTHKNYDALILEMDYWTNVPLEVGLKGKNTSGGAEYTLYGISLYPNQGWQKIYIQLGRLWSNGFSYYPTFKVAFRVSNADGIEGKTYIDNLKLVAYK